MRFHLRYTLLFFCAALILGSCAKMGSLTGGMSDEDPPELVESIPENYSNNFKGKRIELTFDEFIQLTNVNQELVISPPLENRPDIRQRNKSIFIELRDDLRANTTYTLNFGAAIKDNNEGNELTNFEFVFSTGEYLDSLSVAGNILRAFDLEPPEEPVNIMLYDDLSDSVVYKKIPVYIGKSTKDGTYRINNIKADTFKLFALQDVNNNFLFDLPNEKIAFLDTSIILSSDFFSKITKADSDSSITNNMDNTDRYSRSISDTVNLINIDEDSLMIKTEKTVPDEIFVDLFLFIEDRESQFLTDNSRNSPGKIEFSFNLSVSDSFLFRSVIPESQDWYLKEMNETGSDFVLWITNDEVIRMDTITMMLGYVVEDSTNQRIWKRDTLTFSYRDLTVTGRKTDEEAETEKSMEIQAIKNNAVLELNEDVKIISGTPVNYIDTSRIEFFRIVDTMEVREPYTIYQDSSHLRRIIFDKKWESRAKYHFKAYPGAFTDIYGNTIDTIDARFSVRDEEYYGSLIVNIDTVVTPLIVQLLDRNDAVLKEKQISKNQEVRFDYLTPGMFKLKIIYDQNNNGKWDTGIYIKGRQPEKVQFYQGEINVRANWELGVNVQTRKLSGG